MAKRRSGWRLLAVKSVKKRGLKKHRKGRKGRKGHKRKGHKGKRGGGMFGDIAGLAHHGLNALGL